MSNLLRSFKGKLEVVGRGRRLPGLDGLSRRHPIKRVVDFDAIEFAGVVPEELLVGKILGIEHRAPFFIAEARGAEPNLRHCGIMAQVAAKNPREY